MKRIFISFICQLSFYWSALYGQILFEEDFGSISNGVVLSENNTAFDHIRNSQISAVSLNPSTIGTGASLTWSGDHESTNENLYAMYSDIVDMTTSTFRIKSSNMSGGEFVFYEGGAPFNSDTMFSDGTIDSDELLWGIYIDQGVLKYRNVANNWVQVGSITLSDDVPYMFRIVVNNSTVDQTYEGSDEVILDGTMDIYLNGSLIAEGMDLPSNSSWGTRGLKLYVLGNLGTFEFDDLLVQNDIISPYEYHPILGKLGGDNGNNLNNLVWSYGLSGWLDLRSPQLYFSERYGEIQLGGDSGWIFSSFFGWTHFGVDENAYSGWVNTERFGWMKFESLGQSTYLWAPMMNSWMSVNGDGSFYSFQWRQLTPEGLNRYQSSVFGGLTTGDFGGWVNSDRYGWMWANGDGTWFWSETRQEWLGVTAQGGIWSTKEGRFL